MGRDAAAAHGGIATHLGIPMAIISGCLYASAANLASYVAHKEETGQKRTRWQLHVVDAIAFTGYTVGGVIMTAAYASGAAVPVINATMVATNLLMNMLLQVVLGITFYSKDMRMGTIIFALSVYQLAHLAPTPRDDSNALTELTQPLALGWIVAVVAGTVVASWAVWATLSRPTESVPKILAWSALISFLSAVTDNVASAFKLLDGWWFRAALFAYLALSFVVLALSTKAPGLCEASVYVPLQLCTQLLLNMITGSIVWGDQDRLSSPQAYLTAFAVCICSVYVASANVDLLASGLIRLRSMQSHMTGSRFGRSVLELVASWQSLSYSAAKSPADEESAEEALRTMLNSGYQWNIFQADKLIDLILRLHGDRGTFAASAPLVHWLERMSFIRKYEHHHPDFAKALRSTLDLNELSKLEALQAGGNFGEEDDEEDTLCSSEP